MGLASEIYDDAAEITGNEDDFGVQITLTSPDSETASLIGLSRNIGHKLDQTTGQVVNTTNPSVTIHEKNILAANADYPVRNSDVDSDHYKKVDMTGHLVTVTDPGGVTWDYVVLQQKADQTTGLIVLFLGYYRE